MRYYVYALRSIVNGKMYIGITTNPDRRLKEHNAGMTKSTKSYRPYVKIYQEQCFSRTDARNKEKYYKSGCGREFLNQFGQD